MDTDNMETTFALHNTPASIYSTASTSVVSQSSSVNQQIMEQFAQDEDRACILPWAQTGEH